MLDNDLINEDAMQNQEFQCLGMNDDLTDQTAIQELEHLVNGAHLHADSSDITKIIQYHDSDVSAIGDWHWPRWSYKIERMIPFQMLDYQIQQIEHNISADIQKVGVSCR